MGAEKLIIKYLPLMITVCTAIAGVAGFVIARVRRNYGVERDIAHLKRDSQSLSDNMNMLNTELERRLDAVEKKVEVIQAVNQTLISQRMHHREQ